MRRLILMAAMSAVVLAKPNPETYKETEDFQYSRSSSDDGTKSGFYGAQRGNMGGNYERAHNMDNLAQHQMSGLVRQIDGELGDGAKQRTGSVYTAANSRGIYGSGHYDLSNLQGRNFAEGESDRNSQSHSSLSSQNSRYGSQSYSGMESSSGISSSHSQDARYTGYQTSRHTDQRQIDNLQALDTSQGLGRYEGNNQAGYNMKYHTQYDSRGRNEYDQSSANLHSSSGYDGNSQARYVTTPVRVVVRPGGRVAIPITAPTYAVSQNVLPDNNGVNSDAELLNPQVGSNPTNKVKHYEASYSYRKQWEKHHALPGDVSHVVPTENPFPKNSELYEDAQLLQSAKNQFQNVNLQTVNSGNTNSDHRAYSKSSRSKFHEGYNSQQSQSGFDSQQSQSGLSSQQSQAGLSSHQSQAGLRSQQSQAGLRSQQSQAGLSSQQSEAGLSSQQIQAALNSQQSQLGYNSQNSHLGSNSQQSSASSDIRSNAYGRNAQISDIVADLTNTGGDGNSKPKSYHSSYSYHKSWERQGDPYVIKPAYDGQASERLTAASSNSAAYSSRQYGSHSKQAHQSYSADCDDQGHIRVARSSNTDQETEQVQNQWEDLGQQTQSKLENLEDLGQQQQQNKWDNLQDLGQQTQNQWDNLQQLGQETQNQWGNLQQAGQETQNQWENLQQLGQQTQNKWDNLEDLGQQTHRDLEQHPHENLEDFSQQSQKEDVSTNFEQHANNQNENLDFLNQQIQKENPSANFEQQANSQNENLDVLNQHIQKENPLANFEQQANNQNENIEQINQHAQKDEVLTNFEQQAGTQNVGVDFLSHERQNEQSLTNFEQQTNSQNEKLPSSNNWDQITGFESQSNVDDGNQQFQTVNNEKSNNRNLFDQSQQNMWYQSNTNVDKNIDSYDFMKPISQETESNDKNSQQQNLFSSPTSDTDSNKYWPQNKEQDDFWNTFYKENKDNEFEHNIWNTNNFNSMNNQFENNFRPNPISSSDTGHPLQSLWDKIDNVAGEITATQGNTDDKNQFAHDNSNYDSQDTNTNDMRNGWTMPPNPNVDLTNTNIDTGSNEKTLGQKNLFDEQTQDTSTSLPILPTTVENINTPNKIHNRQPNNVNHNKHSEDVGRGDIGPEETPLEIATVNKPYKTPQEIENLSLTKETLIPKEEKQIKPNLSKNTDETPANKLYITNVNPQDSTTFSTVHSSVITAKPTARSSTTAKSNINDYSVKPPNQPISDVIEVQNNPLPELQKQTSHQATVEKFETPEDIQQQNLEQQNEDFTQLQQQSSWLPSNNLQQGYDQQNMEQQYLDLNQHENVQDQKSLQDFSQNIQHFSPSVKYVENKEVQQKNPSQHQGEVILNTPNIDEQKSQTSSAFKEPIANTPQIMEPIHVARVTDVSSQDKNVQDKLKVESPKSADVPSPVETSSESPGFWKSVGRKFTNAKNKVCSWFSSSC